MKIIINLINGGYTFGKWTPPCTHNKAGQPVEPQECYMPPSAIVTEVDEAIFEGWVKVREAEDRMQDELREAYITKWSLGTWNGKGAPK